MYARAERITFSSLVKMQIKYTSNGKDENACMNENLRETNRFRKQEVDQ